MTDNRQRLWAFLRRDHLTEKQMVRFRRAEAAGSMANGGRKSGRREFRELPSPMLPSVTDATLGT